MARRITNSTVHMLLVFSSLKITWSNILKMPAYKTAIGLIVVVIAATDYAGASADEQGIPLRTECRRTLSKTADQGESQSGNDEVPSFCLKTCESTTTIVNKWSGHFEGAMHIPITNEVTGEWTATIYFENEVNALQLWNAKFYDAHIEEALSIYIITNESWNPNLYAGTFLDDVGFIANIPDDQLPQPFYVQLYFQPSCHC
ncbi:hypothetical protein HOLleu_10308 [Holothuria leucospilota]|uniref:Uncharacterized protein n=1 Tax=Holothuria leucospilota TaxID=206669 RepID=A0A9Q1CEQ1_HOLLE|nr:hypothetical protein HOLleu_10308 [Holothuria leucospilota]